MKDSIIAKLAAQTSDFYSSAIQAANVTAAKQLFDKVPYCTVRRCYYNNLLNKCSGVLFKVEYSNKLNIGQR